MLQDTFEKTRDLTIQLAQVQSINKAPGEETAMAQYIYDYYEKMPYFKEHPERLIFQKTLDDTVLRHNTIAYIKGTKNGGSNKTVILMGHFDTVGIDDFNEFAEYATKPEELPAIFKEHFVLSDEILEDIDSGKYLFGRGVLDMKSGIALHMVLMEYFCEHPEELCGNVIALHTCDEEDASKGIISTLTILSELREKEGFEYITSINADFTTNYSPDDRDYYVYLGAIGKYLPTCSFFGKESHVGQPFSSLDPNFLAAIVTKNVSLNPRLSDLSHGELTVPPVSLGQRDFKDIYTVQTALTSQVYYNVFTHGKTSEKILSDFEAIVEESYQEAIELLNERYRKYCEMAGIEYTSLPWKTNVIRFEDLCREAAQKNPDFPEELKAFKDQLNKTDPQKDMREFNQEVVEFVWDKRKEYTPCAVIYFSSVLIPPQEILGDTDNEKKLLRIVQEVIQETPMPEGVRMREKYFYPYIADSSFMSVGDEDYEAYINNMPSWGYKYTHQFDLIRDINVPVINLGPHGKDGHMISERVDQEHTFRRVPKMTYEILLRLLD